MDREKWKVFELKPKIAQLYIAIRPVPSETAQKNDNVNFFIAYQSAVLCWTLPSSTTTTIILLLLLSDCVRENPRQQKHHLFLFIEWRYTVAAVSCSSLFEFFYTTIPSVFLTARELLPHCYYCHHSASLTIWLCKRKPMPAETSSLPIHWVTIHSCCCQLFLSLWILLSFWLLGTTLWQHRVVSR